MSLHSCREGLRHRPWRCALRTALGLLLLLALAASPVRALDIPAAPESRVNDYAGLLAAEARAELENKLAALERSGGPQVFVAIFQSLENESLEEFSIRLAEQWKAGGKTKDNGALILLFMKERRIRIEVGYGLEAQIPDVMAGRIIRDMQPYFRNNDYSGGLSRAADQIAALAGGSAVVTEERGRELTFPLHWVVYLVIFLFLRGIMPRRASSGFRIDGRGMQQNAIPWWLPYAAASTRRHPRGGMDLGGGGWGGFGGGGGGFSGGGGGSFGGGGASGGW